MATSLPEFAKCYSEAWAAHDPGAIAAMHTEDTVFHLHGLAEPQSGGRLFDVRSPSYSSNRRICISSYAASISVRTTTSPSTRSAGVSAAPDSHARAPTSSRCATG